MARPTESIAADIAAIEPTSGNWLGLEALLEELWTDGSPHAAIPQMRAVFERFPSDIGAGVFWSIVHGLESLPGYEAHLVRSVRRVPSEMGVTMLGRLLNAGCDDIDGVPIRDLLEEVVTRSDAGATAKATASSFLERGAASGV
jgi:hypothetical protein